MTIITSDEIPRLVAAIQRGEVVAIPTDTVYGVAARADDRAAVERLAELKGRAVQQPVQLLVASIEAIAPHIEDASGLELVRPFWPGPLTAILRMRPGFASAALTSEGTIGVRVPDDPLAIAVIEACGGALAASSANRHGEQPCLTAAEVEATFGESLLILDGGPRHGGVASTVVDLVSRPARVLREGPVSAEDLGLSE